MIVQPLLADYKQRETFTWLRDGFAWDASSLQGNQAELITDLLKFVLKNAKPPKWMRVDFVGNPTYTSLFVVWVYVSP